MAEMGGQGNIAAIRVALLAVLGRWGLEASEADCNYFPAPAICAARLRRHGFDVPYIELIPRPTTLPASGMRGWLETFRRGVLEQVPENEREQAVDECVRLLAPALQDEDGNWTADYVRLRFMAVAV